MSGIAALVLRHPSIKRLRRVAEALGDLAPRVVFIGGSIAPLLQTVPPFDEARPTTDVDGLVATAAYAEINVLHTALRARGFRQPLSESAHVHRWRSPQDDALDLVPAGQHLGGSGQRWDQMALDAPTLADLGDEVLIRHAGGPAFLALKWAAYADRGSDDPYASHDLEDILALVASRPALVGEVSEAPAVLRDFVGSGSAALLADPRLRDILAGHLNNAQDPHGTAHLVLGRLREIRALTLRK